MKPDEPMRRPDIPPDLHQQLVAWAQWCRGKHLPAWFSVLCQSAERAYLPEAGNVWQTATEALQASVQAHQRLAGGQDMLHVELAVLRLPERPRMALRLHYVVHKRMPVEQKCRKLGVSVEAYPGLVETAARLIA